jgi:lipoprotein-anchoring transpeptidase ErfK/SrfK
LLARDGNVPKRAAVPLWNCLSAGGKADVKALKLLLALALVTMLAVAATPSSAQSFLDNIKNSLQKLGNPPPQDQRKSTETATVEPPKVLKNLKRAFNDFTARQSSLAAGVPREYARNVVRYRTRHAPGTIIIDPQAHYLYFVLENDEAIRYGVGVGREGFGWSGTTYIGRKAEWPDWTPPPEMIVRERERGVILPTHMKGGLMNPLGARALYLYRNGNDTAYRIHGSRESWTIGQNVSSGCFRMTNTDVIDLYKRAKVGAKVIVL